MIDSAPQRATASQYGSFLWVYTDVVHLRQIDDEAIIADAQAAGIVAAAADGDAEPILAAEVYRRDNVCHIDAARDDTRSPVDHPVINLASLIIARIARFDNLTAQAAFERGDGCFTEHRILPAFNRASL
jgi:hypothetical protein